MVFYVGFHVSELFGVVFLSMEYVRIPTLRNNVTLGVNATMCGLGQTDLDIED